MNLKALQVWVSPYWMDEQYDVLFIRISDDPTCTLVGFIEVPSGESYEILTRENENDLVGAIEIINPQGFMRSEKANEIMFHGQNLKQFVTETMNQAS